MDHLWTTCGRGPFACGRAVDSAAAVASSRRRDGQAGAVVDSVVTPTTDAWTPPHDGQRGSHVGGTTDRPSRE